MVEANKLKNYENQSSELIFPLKVRIFRATFETIYTYGVEIWTTIKSTN